MAKLVGADLLLVQHRALAYKDTLYPRIMHDTWAGGYATKVLSCRSCAATRQAQYKKLQTCVLLASTHKRFVDAAALECGGGFKMC